MRGATSSPTPTKGDSEDLGRKGEELYIPQGYGTVFPYVVVPHAEEFVSFLKTVFDAKELGRTVFGSRIANVRISIGTTNFMVSEAADDSLCGGCG